MTATASDGRQPLGPVRDHLGGATAAVLLDHPSKEQAMTEVLRPAEDVQATIGKSR